jgi:DNA-binding NarL/FixJ family response regulator
VASLDGRTAVVFDRHPLWIDALDELLGRTGVEVVRAETEEDAVELVETRAADVLIAGVESEAPLLALEGAKEASPETKLLVLGVGRGLVGAAFARGADAYVLKSAQPDDVASAVRQLFDQSVYVSEAAAAEPEPPGEEPEQPLTRRELEILGLASEGMTNAAMARKLWVTEQTVKFHLSNVYKKLGVANRTEASRWAYERGLFADEAGPALQAEG